MTCLSHEIIGNGALVIVSPRDGTRGVNARLFEPPRMYVIYYNIERDEPRIERISFEVAEALAPEKYAEAVKLLMEARRRDSPPLNVLDGGPSE